MAGLHASQGLRCVFMMMFCDLSRKSLHASLSSDQGVDRRKCADTFVSSGSWPSCQCHSPKGTLRSSNRILLVLKLNHKATKRLPGCRQVPHRCTGSTSAAGNEGEAREGGRRKTLAAGRGTTEGLAIIAFPSQRHCCHCS